MHGSKLLPIFRSDAQARILAWFLLDPDREVPAASLASVADVHQTTALREVSRLVEAGLLKERRAGHTRLLRADTDSPYYLPLSQILARSFGPLQVVSEELAGVAGIEHVEIVGSWAARFLGTPGGQPRDLDIVVVGAPSGRELRRASSRMEERMQIPVHVTTVAADEWTDRGSGFVVEVRSKPSVPVELTAAP